MLPIIILGDCATQIPTQVDTAPSRIDWLTEGTETVAQGDTVAVRSGAMGLFVRANVIGPGGVAFTQPFRVIAGVAQVPVFPYRLGWAA